MVGTTAYWLEGDHELEYYPSDDDEDIEGYEDEGWYGDDWYGDGWGADGWHNDYGWHDEPAQPQRASGPAPNTGPSAAPVNGGGPPRAAAADYDWGRPSGVIGGIMGMLVARDELLSEPPTKYVSSRSGGQAYENAEYDSARGEYAWIEPGYTGFGLSSEAPTDAILPYDAWTQTYECEKRLCYGNRHSLLLKSGEKELTGSLAQAQEVASTHLMKPKAYLPEDEKIQTQPQSVLESREEPSI